MYFNDLKEIEKISARTNCAVFVVPDNLEIKIKNAIVLRPEEKTIITIDQVRDVIARILTRQQSERYIVIRPADKLGEISADALLKSLEEPGEKIHFVLITSAPSQLLPTILSRAQIYFFKNNVCDDTKIDAESNDINLAKKMIVAKGAEFILLANEITARKNETRSYALRIISISIEMLYKSYYLTNREQFLKKIPKFLKLYENLEENGHIKLHLVSDLI